jgi:predicted Fe-Mo cluster-binding NifX family protein
MKIVVTADGAGLDAPASTVFGRCQSYVFVETDTMEAETVENPAMNAASGAGIQAAQFVVERGAEAVATGNVGPNAFSVLEASNVPVYLLRGGTVREVVEAYEEGELPEVGEATGPAHSGMGRAGGRGRGGRAAPRGRSTAPSAPAEAERAPGRAGEEEVSELKGMVADLRKQLAEVMDRLDELEEE